MSQGTVRGSPRWSGSRHNRGNATAASAGLPGGERSRLGRTAVVLERTEQRVDAGQVEIGTPDHVAAARVLDQVIAARHHRLEGNRALRPVRRRVAGEDRRVQPHAAAHHVDPAPLVRGGVAGDRAVPDQNPRRAQAASVNSPAKGGSISAHGARLENEPRIDRFKTPPLTARPCCRSPCFARLAPRRVG